MKTIYELELHESVEIEDGIVVMRVPGGWIYETVFVPYSNEFDLVGLATLKRLLNKRNVASIYD